MRGSVVFVLGWGYGLAGLLVLPAGFFNAAVALKTWTESPVPWSVAILAGGELLVAATCMLISGGLFARRRWAAVLAAGFNVTVLLGWSLTLPWWWLLERGLDRSLLPGLTPFALLLGVTALVLSKPMRQFMA